MTSGSPGMMVEGEWTTERPDRDPSGKFTAISTTFRDRVTADRSSGFKAESGRDRPYIAVGCPWAHRTYLMRELKGLNDAISIAIFDPIIGERGWMFSQAPGVIPDSVNHATYLQ